MNLNEAGLFLKNERAKENISQEELSFLTGISHGQLSRIESGNLNFTMLSFIKICSALNINEFNLKNDDFESLHPFVKWAGGKTQILDKISIFFPKKFNRYFEPFVGGGAVLFYLKPAIAFINDSNKELTKTYSCFEDDKKLFEMLNLLKKYESKHNDEFYYKVREMDRSDKFSLLSDSEIAARFIYLNKACFNGLYRVNSSGYFNVPSGKKNKVKTFDEDNIKDLRNFFKTHKITVLNEDFESSVKDAQKGDFVYFDPPYDTWDDKSSFTSYQKDAFGKDEQVRLAKVYKELSNKGVYVMLSNQNTSLIQSLYKDFNIHIINAKRMINSNPNGRGDVQEVVITNY